MSFEWAVIGAGPAGIKPQHIAWIAPYFKVGDFGALWKKVESNTPVSDFNF